MPSRIEEAGHTKAFDYPVAEHWGESQRTKRSLVGLEPTSTHTYESDIQRSTTYATPTKTSVQAKARPQVMTFNGPKNPLSNFFPVKLTVNGETYCSSEQAYQHRKANFIGQTQAADLIMRNSSPTAIKAIGNSLQYSSDWEGRKAAEMRKIAQAKLQQCPELYDILNNNPNAVFAESVMNQNYWGSGLSSRETALTPP